MHQNGANLPRFLRRQRHRCCSQRMHQHLTAPGDCFALNRGDVPTSDTPKRCKQPLQHHRANDGSDETMTNAPSCAKIPRLNLQATSHKGRTADTKPHRSIVPTRTSPPSSSTTGKQSCWHALRVSNTAPARSSGLRHRTLLDMAWEAVMSFFFATDGHSSSRKGS